MEDEPHEVVKLLVARMESHPEEFSSDKERFSDRWERYISDIEAFGNEADKAALNAKLRDIWMDKIHEKVMDELLNGEDRRRKEAEDREYELHIAHAARQQQTLAQQQKAYVNQIQGMVGQAQGFQNANALGQLGAYDFDLDKYRNTPTGSITGMKANSIRIDDEELDAPMIKRMKRMMLGRSK
jgi:hypothetical protein